jgi:hypothetical protein
MQRYRMAGDRTFSEDVYQETLGVFWLLIYICPVEHVGYGLQIVGIQSICLYGSTTMSIAKKNKIIFLNVLR